MQFIFNKSRSHIFQEETYPMTKSFASALLFTFLAANLVTTDAEARFFRMAKVPNAVADCNTCHTNGGGTARNPFGLDVQALVTPNGEEVFWGAELAALDSDGDGFTNGEELGDPEGLWQEGDPSPGDLADLGDPGNPDIVPNLPEPEPTAVDESSWGAIKRLGRLLLD
jgi:hypothetical protein